MTTTEINAVLLRGILTCLLGLYALISGWKLVRSPDRARPVYFRIGVIIARIFQGELAANKREMELMNPIRIRQHGYLGILTGSLLILGGGLQLIALALI